MPYLISSILIATLLLCNSWFNIFPTTTWILSYIIVFATIKGKIPFDPRLWLFVPWAIIFINLFSGVRYVPKSINFFAPISYVCILISCFFIGFQKNKNKIKRGSKIRINTFLSQEFSKKNQKIISFHAILGILGAIFILFDIFFLLKLSIHGGDRRAEFMENFDNLSALTTVGMLLIGGCYMPIFSAFFQGNVKNKILGSIALLSLGLYSIAIGGKQGIFLVFLILIFIFSIKYTYAIKIKIPFFVKYIYFLIIFFFFSYLSLLSSERHGNAETGELLSNSAEFSQEFIEKMGPYIPKDAQNTFAEFFGYYGDQLGTFAERWNLDDYPHKYAIIEFPPRVLEPFVWVKRQVVKILPLYNEIFPPSENLIRRISNQNKGYYGLANWQTTAVSGLRLFGFLGQIILVFFHGYYSKSIYVKVLNKPSFSLVHASLLNNVFLVYTTMMNAIGETSLFVYLVLIGFYYYRERKTNSPYPYI